ncbi:MAG: hypothetical protein WC008_04940 [Bacilli bacterium]
MKLKIRAEGVKLNLYIPFFILNNKWIIKKITKKSTKDIDFDQLKIVLPKMIKELKKFKKDNKGFVILDVVSSDNEHVVLKL